MTCERCFGTLAIGDHGLGLCPLESRRGAAGVIDDTLPGGARWIENMGDAPVWIETKTQFQQECAARGIEPMVRHVEGDQHVQAWTGMDAQTLENARVLVSRPAERRAWGEDIPQAPVIERYTRMAEDGFTVQVAR